MRYRVTEKFISINGEGNLAGELAVFIRFAGCNLRCGYCDTMWANREDAEYEWMTGKKIHDYIVSTGIRNVTLTGGEPLIQEGIGELLSLLAADERLRVEIETNGSVNIGRFSSLEGRPPVFTVDYKLSSSGMEYAMELDNFCCLKQEDTVKFVVGSMEDLEKVKHIIDRYLLNEKCGVHISPVFGEIDMETIVEFMKKNKLNGVKMQPQLHKIIWHPNARGV